MGIYPNSIVGSKPLSVKTISPEGGKSPSLPQISSKAQKTLDKRAAYC